MLRRFLASIALALSLGVAGISVAAAASADTAPASEISQSATTQNAPSFWW